MSALLESFAYQFDVIHDRSSGLLERLPEARLFWRPESGAAKAEPYSCGELLIRSAASVEQAFGGLTTRLWDDPFEWTLPEELASRAKVLEYLNETKAATVKGLDFLNGPSDLERLVPAPETLKPIAQILLETIDRASHLQGRAFGVAQMFLRIRPYLR